MKLFSVVKEVKLIIILLMIKNNPVKRVPFHKKLVLVLDSKVDFKKHNHRVVQS